MWTLAEDVDIPRASDLQHSCDYDIGSQLVLREMAREKNKTLLVETEFGERQDGR